MVDESVFVGTWDMVSNENLFEFLQQLGSKNVEGDKISFSLSKVGDVWIQSVEAGDTAVSYSFNSGVKFAHTTADGRDSTSTITLDGNTLTQVQTVGTFNIKTTRVFDGESMVTTIVADGVALQPTATFNRVSSA